MGIGARGTIAAVAMWLAFSSASSAARLAAPPSVELASTPGASLVRVRITDLDDPAAVGFAIVSRLEGDRTPPRLILPIDPETRAYLDPTRRYLIGVSDKRAVKLPGGRSVIDVPHYVVRATSAGEILCLDAGPCRELLLRPHAKHRTDETRTAAALLEALADDDAPTSRLAAAELATRRDLHAMLDPGLGKSLHAFAIDALRDARARALVLELGEAMGPPAAGAWTHDAARRILISTPLELDRAPQYVPMLVAHALQLVGRAPRRADDVALVSRWVSSPHAGVVETAMDVRSALSPDDGLAFVESLLARPLPNGDVRAVLEQRRRRLELM